jgi:hypothetical protein
MSFRYNDEIRQALEAIKERDGAPLQEQVRRAVLMWIDVKGMPNLSPRRAALAARAARLTDEIDTLAQLKGDKYEVEKTELD